MERSGRGHERILREFLKLRQELGGSDAVIAENQRLRNEASIYRLLLYEISELALYGDADLNIIYANRAAVTLLSPASSILGIKLPELFTEEDRGKVREAADMALNGAAVSIKARVLASGAVLRLRLRPCFGASNNITGVLASGEPLTFEESAPTELLKEKACLDELLKVRTEELIEANELLLSEMDASERAECLARDVEAAHVKLLNLMSDAVLVADCANGRILSANRPASALLKRPVNEITGLHFTELHPPELADECARIFTDVLEKGHASDIRLPVRDFKGNSMPVSISAFTSALEGRLIAYVVFRDLSEPGRRDGERSRTDLFIEELDRIISRPARA